MKKLLMIPLLALLMGCASFSTNTYRTEQTVVNLAHAAYVGWTNYLFQFPAKVTPQASNEVRQARLRFAASVITLESLRSGYETNSALKGQVQGTLATVLSQGSNYVWLVNYWRQQ